ncbi:hypothetical protein [Phenylobacterium sp.]|uniref:terminase small subunit-like protein n=1 Tax=Phenylobacterium sp. TaxID=1871053 RepID=UPI0035ADE7B7
MTYRFPFKAHVKLAIVERLKGGETLAAICAEAEMPSTVLVHGWARADPVFAEEVRAARALAEARRLVVVDAAKVREILRRVAAGEKLHLILQKTPGMPSRETIKHWRGQDLFFDSELRSIWSRRREGVARKPVRAFGQAAADKILIRSGRGGKLRDILRSDKAFPCLAVLERWRREQPEFDAELKVCMRFGKAARKKAQVDALKPDIVDALLEGGSLRSLARGWAAAGRRDRPSLRTLYNWVATRPDFAGSLALACRMRDEMLIDRLCEAAMAVTSQNVAEMQPEVKRAMARQGRLARGLGRKWADEARVCD